jgi:hypothetical protein
MNLVNLDFFDLAASRSLVRETVHGRGRVLGYLLSIGAVAVSTAS